jgi:hypothetical protein
MNNLFKYSCTTLLLISLHQANALPDSTSEVPLFFQGNPFSPENSKTRLKGVKVISVNDKYFPKELRSSQKEVISEIKQYGFLTTKESKATYLKNTIAKIKEERSLNKISSKKVNEQIQITIASLNLEMSNLEDTHLKNSNLIEIKASGAKQDSGWTGLSRLFEDKYFGIIILEEDNYNLHGGAVIFVSELVNVSINGNPGILIEERDENNLPYTILHWADHQKSYTLKTTVSTNEEKSRTKIIQLAESLH